MQCLVNLMDCNRIIYVIPIFRFGARPPSFKILKREYSSEHPYNKFKAPFTMAYNKLALSEKN